MSKRYVSPQEIRYEAFLNRENAFRHHTYEEDMRQYDLLRQGDPRAPEEAERMFAASEQGTLSDDPVTNLKYLFVASAALASRTAMSAGVDPERCQNTSDLYIRRMDRCVTEDEIRAAQREMFEVYTRAVAAVDRERAFSRPVLRCMDRILNHLNEPLRIGRIAEEIGLSPNYLSALFRAETGLTVTEYIARQRIDTARSMLLHSDAGYAEIAACLGFSSQSHFTRVFRELTGVTPARFRRQSLP